MPTASSPLCSLEEICINGALFPIAFLAALLACLLVLSECSFLRKAIKQATLDHDRLSVCVTLKPTGSDAARVQGPRAQEVHRQLVRWAEGLSDDHHHRLLQACIRRIRCGAHLETLHCRMHQGLSFPLQISALHLLLSVLSPESRYGTSGRSTGIAGHDGTSGMAAAAQCIRRNHLIEHSLFRSLPVPRLYQLPF